MCNSSRFLTLFSNANFDIKKSQAETLLLVGIFHRFHIHPINFFLNLDDMISYGRFGGQGDVDIPQAPLIKESLENIDIDFQKVKRQLGRALPLLSREELLE
jgi:hypothetical protein